MSLDVFNKDTLFSRMSTNDYFIKVIYNRLKPDFDYNENIQILENLHNNIIDNIDDTNLLDTQFQSIEKNYISPSNTDQIKYIFIPKVDKNIKNELDKISTRKSLDGIDLDLLSTHFEMSIDKFINNIGPLIGFTEIYFIEFIINIHDNIHFLLNILGHYLNIEGGDIFEKDSLLLYSNNIIGKRIYNEKYNIISEYKKNTNTFTVSTLKNIINGYLVPPNITEYIINKYENDITAIDRILDEYVITKYIEKYLKFKQIGYKYIIKNRLEYPVDTYIFNYFNTKNIRYQQDISISSIGLTDTSKTYTLEYEGNSKDNTYYVYNMKNILQNLENTNIIDKNVTQDTIAPIYNHFIKKVFPNIDITRLLEIRNTNIIDKASFDKQQNLLNNYSIISSSYHKYSINKNTSYIKPIFQNNFILHINHKLILPPQFDIRNIFNEFLLSEDIPFVKYRDRLGYKDVIYKIYKPVTKQKKYKYIPKINKDKLTNWIKFKGYEFNDGILKQVRAIPKDISYKIKIIENKSDVIYKGVVFKINKNSVDVEHNDVILEDIPKSYILDNIVVGKEIQFHKYDALYADLDISRKGYLDCYINTENINLENYVYILENIGTILNNFIEKLYLIDSLQSYRIFDNKIYNEQLNSFKKYNDTKISNMIYNYNVKIPLKIKITYDFLYKISKLLYPYVVVNEEPFNRDDNIQYFDSNKKVWINGKIIMYNIDNKYTITLFDDRYGETTNREVNNVDVTSLKPLESVSSKRMFEVIFRKIPEFNNSPPITNLIIKLSNSGLSPSDILERIMHNFNLDKSNATEIIGSILANSNVVSIDRLVEKLDSEIGISIKIDYIPQLLSDKTDNVKVYIQNVKSINQISEVYKFISYFFDLYLVLNNHTNLDIFNNVNEFYKQNTTDSLEKQKEETNNITETQVIENKIELEDLDDIDYDDLDALEDEIDDVNPIIQKDESIDEDDITEIYNKRVKAEIEKSVSQSYGKEIKNKVLLKLYENDPELFDWDVKKSTKDNVYARQCQAGRQPSVLTQDEKDEIDSVNPYAYATTKQDIDCKNKNSFTGKQDPKCKALYYGTTEENKKWYICPRIIDLTDNKPLTWSDLDYKLIDGNTFISLDEEHPEYWRLDKNTTKVKYDKNKKTILKIESAGKDILDYSPSYNGKTIIKDTGIVTPKESIYIISKKFPRTYPGFLSKGAHPRGLAMPCCFNNSSMRVKSYFEDGLAKKTIDDNTYIQSWGKQLENNRLGLLPEIMYRYFENIDTPSTGNIAKSKDKNWILRKGILQDNDSFLRLMADFQEISIEQLKHKIIDNLTKNKFVNLNKGNLEIEFQNMGLQSPFQNFLEYTLSDQYKLYKYYYELLVNTRGFGFDKPNNVLIILDYDIVDGKETVDLLCPYFTNKNIKETSEQIRVYIAIKYGNVFEPIYRYSGSSKTIKYFLSSSEYIKRLYKIFDNNCDRVFESNIINVAKTYKKIIYNKLVPINRIYDQLVKIAKTHPSYEPKILVRDNYNKVIGIYLQNNTIVPVYPQNIVKDIPLYTLGINVSRLTTNKLEIIIETYENLKKLSNNIIDIDIVKFFVDNEDFIKGFVTNTGIYIHISTKTKLSNYSSLNIDKIYNDYSYIDKVIKSYQEDYNKLVYKEPIEYNILKSILDNITIVNNKFKIISYVTFDGKTSNIIKLDCSIYIEIQPISIDLLESYKRLDRIDEIDNFTTVYISNAIELSRLSDYRIPCIPTRYLMDDNKMYKNVIIETGLVLPLKTHFSITDKINNKYTVLYLIDNPIIDRLFGETIIDKNVFINERIISIEKQKYLRDIFEISKIELYGFFQNPKNSFMKQFFKHTLGYVGLDYNQKKRILYPIFSLIFNSIVSPEYKEYIIHPKLNLKKTCTNSDCKLDNCIIENIKYDKIEDENRYFEMIINLVYDKSIKSDTSVFKDMNNKIGLIEKDFIKKALKNYNNLVDILNGENSVCKTQIIENAENTRIKHIKGLIIEEMIRNKYKRKYILESYKTILTNERFKVNEPYELLIHSTDINASIINDLYDTIQKKYYSDIVPFDDSEQHISISDLSLDKYNDECFIGKTNTTNIKKTMIKKKNLNLSINNNIEILDKDIYDKLYKNIMNMNTKLDLCKIKEKRQYYIKIIDNKKKLK